MNQKATFSLSLFRAKLHLKRRVNEGQFWMRPALEVLRGIVRLRRSTLPRAGGPYGADADGKLPCPLPFREMVINCDGSVACGSTAGAPVLDRFELHGAPRSLSDVWNGHPFRAMRSRMLAEDNSGCQGCQLYRNPDFSPVRDLERLAAGENRGSGFIQQLLIEPTAQCNFDCPTICGQSYPKPMQPVSKRSVRFMPLELFKRIVDGINLPIQNIRFYNYGEPTLHPDFTTMLHLMREKCPSSHISTSTNGSRLRDPKLRAGLLASGLDEIIVSIDGARQETYGLYRKGGLLEEILDGLSRLREERERAGLARPRITWRYILFAWNDAEAELALAERRAQEIGVDRFCYHLSDLPDFASRTYAPGSPAFERVRPLLY